MEFWNKTHPLESEYDRFFDLLVPSSGKSDSIAGEILRAASRIYYDHYNNGSCNNVTGAWNFLDTMLPGLMVSCGMHDRLAEVNSAMLTVAPYMNCNGLSVNFEEDDLNQSMDTLVEVAVLIAQDHEKNDHFLPNSIDMFDYQEEEEYEEEEYEEEEWY